MLSRRSLLKLAGSATFFAAMRGNTVVAQTTQSPLWVQLFGVGGWDQMLFCDPKLGVRDPTYTNPSAVRTTDGISYLHTSATLSQFFVDHAKNMLVINGIDTGTNNHDVGVRYCMSGSSLEGFPVFSAQVAGALGKSRVMPLVNISGYDEAGGLLAPVRLDYVGVPNMKVLQTPQTPSGTDEYLDPLGYLVDSSSPYLPDSSRALVGAAHQARLQRQLAGASLPTRKAGITALQVARVAAGGLKDVQLPTVDNNAQNSYRSLITMGINAFKAGLATSINVATGSLDSHGISDAEHLLELGKVFDLAQHTIAQANAAGIPVIVVMSSDFGRTPVREGSGSGHWPVASMLIVQNAAAKAMGVLPGGKVIGMTTGEVGTSNASRLSTTLQAMKIDPTTHAASDTGILLTPAHIFRVLRQAAGIANDPLIRGYPIAVSGGDLVV